MRCSYVIHRPRYKEALPSQDADEKTAQRNSCQIGVGLFEKETLPLFYSESD